MVKFDQITDIILHGLLIEKAIDDFIKILFGLFVKSFGKDEVFADDSLIGGKFDMGDSGFGLGLIDRGLLLRELQIGNTGDFGATEKGTGLFGEFEIGDVPEGS